MPSLFSRILAGEIPGQFIHRSPHWVAILDIRPQAPGHALLIATAEAPLLADLPVEALAALGPVLVEVSAAIKRATGADAVNLLVNDGSAAGQEVPHVHVHLIPRHADDGRHIGPRPAAPAAAADLAAMAQRILAAAGGTDG